MIERWEYKILAYIYYASSIEALTKDVNTLGKEGWELISATPYKGGYATSNDNLLFFKRRLSH